MRQLKSGKSLFSKTPSETIEHERGLVLTKFISGAFAHHFPTDVFLKKGEKLIFDTAGIQLCKNKTLKTNGSHPGVFSTSNERRIVPL